MKKTIHIVLISLLCVLFVASLFLQRSEILFTEDTDKYNFNFNIQDSTIPKWRTFSSAAQIDSSEFINGKYPLWFKQIPETSSPALFLNPLIISLCQVFSIPQNAGDSIKIVLNSKSKKISTGNLIGVCFDANFNIVYHDSISIKNENWKNDTLSIPTIHTRYLLVGIFALGKEEDPRIGGQNFWLDKISILIGNKNLSEFKIDKQDISLSDKDIIPLDTNKLFNNITIPPSKKIIALGESIHGSGTINSYQIELIKKLIQENKCRLVIFESNMYSALLWNLYIQGKLPEERLSDIKELILFEGISDPDVISDLLIWLRGYNEKPGGRNVYIAGNVEISYCPIISPLFDYIDTYYNETTKELILPLLTLLDKQRHNEGLEYITNNKEQLRFILGEIEYDIFHHALSGLSVQKKIKSLEQSYANLQSRDFSMYSNSKKFIQSLLAEDEIAVIVAHLEHTNKKYSTGVFPYILPMGYYLNEYYGDSYYNIGFLVGEGKITTRKVRQRDLIVTNLKYPQDDSLEKLSMDQSIFSFYYHIPSNKNDYHTKYRAVGNRYLPYMEYNIANLTTQLDAFIFIKESKGYRDMDKNKSLKLSDIMWNRGVKRAGKLKQYNK